MSGLRLYMEQIKRFSPEVRLYLMVSTLQGIGSGIFQLFFNFYILSLGYREDFLGVLISLPALIGLLVSLAAGYVSDLIGRKRTFIIGGVLAVVSQGMMLLWPTYFMLIFSRVISGLGNSLFSVASAPFLMEHSTEEERVHLFSFNSGLGTMSSFIGTTFGGALPAFFAVRMGVAPTSSTAYAMAMWTTTLLMFIALVPLARLPMEQRVQAQRPRELLEAFARQKVLMTKLFLPSLLISIGAGLLIPFMNIFFRNRYGLTDAQIGALMGTGALGMGVAFLFAPLLANRWGKALSVVITQGLSIPFLFILGYVHHLELAILAYFVRMALMNLSTPIYQIIVMEKVDEKTRGMAASLNAMVWNFGRAISPAFSGPIQRYWGFDPIFALTIAFYAVSVAMVQIWFVPRKGAADLSPAGEVSHLS